MPGVVFMPGELGAVPPLLLCPFALPGAEGFVLDPEFGAVLLFVPGAEPGKVPHGEPLGEPPGLFGVFGLIVDGCVVLPGVGVAGDVEPGTVGVGVAPGAVDPGAFGIGGAVCGVAVPAGGVAVAAGGVAVPAVGVAGEPGVDV